MTRIDPPHAPMLGIASDEVRFARDLLAGRRTADAGRDADSLFICEGLWCAEKLIQKKIRVVQVLFDTEYFTQNATPAEAELLNRLCAYSEHAYAISAKACSRISDRDGADTCFVIARMPRYTLAEMPLADTMLIMILDGQEQPGNVGAILRSLDGAGGAFAVMTNRRVRPTHPRLIRSSLGAAFMMPLLDVPMPALTQWLTENRFRIVLTDLTATRAYCDIPAGGRVAVVAGNEHTGIAPAWRTLPGAEPVIIPMLGSVESLNVGFASTLVAYDIGLRQKGLRSPSQSI